MQDYSVFLRHLYRDVEPGTYLSLWSPKAKTSFVEVTSALAALDTDMDVVAAKIEKLKDKDIYYGVCLLGVEPQQGRGRAEDVAVVTCMWADVDVAHGEAHQKSKLPGTQKDATRIMSAVGLEPSMVVHTGHGLHGYWLLKEPWVLDTLEERERCARFARRFSLTLREHARRIGFEVDAVGDLARVMRLPGTRNHKVAGKVVPVRLLEPASPDEEPRRYDVTDIEDLLIAEELFAPKGSELRYAHAASVGALLLDPKAEPPRAKFDELYSQDKKFAARWDGKATGLKDDSPSSMDMSIANFAAAAGWDPQEIADLIIARRRKAKADLKLRQEYYQLTVDAAIRANASARAVEKAAADVEVNRAAELTPDKRAELIEHLSASLGVNVVRWIKEGADDSLYTLIVGDGTEILIGRVDNVLSFARFRGKVYDAVQVLIPKAMGKRWDAITKMLAKLVEVVEVETSEDETRRWVSEYVSSASVAGLTGDDTWQGAFAQGDPFVKDGKLHLMAEPFRTNVRFKHHEDVTAKAMCNRLRRIGFLGNSVTAHVEGESRAKCRFCWAVRIEVAREWIPALTRGEKRREEVA